MDTRSATESLFELKTISSQDKQFDQSDDTKADLRKADRLVCIFRSNKPQAAPPYMLSQNPVNPPQHKNGESSLAAFRDWLMAGGNPNSFFEGTPLIFWLLERDWHDAVVEAWAAGADANARDEQDRGWLHRAITLNAPSWLAMEGFRRLGSTWWKSDLNGITPFHLPVFDKRLSQAMIVRWWTEQRSWKLLTRPFDPQKSDLPQSSAWKSWADVLRP